MEDGNGNGRDTPPVHGPDGRWLKGHKSPGPGNPQFRNLRKFQSIVAEATDANKLKAAWTVLQDKAAAGEPWAVKELLDRVFGKAAQVIVLDDDGSSGSQDTFRAWFEDMMNRPRVVRAIEAEVLESAPESRSA